MVMARARLSSPPASTRPPSPEKSPASEVTSWTSLLEEKSNPPNECACALYLALPARPRCFEVRKARNEREKSVCVGFSTALTGRASCGKSWTQMAFSVFFQQPSSPEAVQMARRRWWR